MTRLNKARVSWKHYGIQVHKQDIETFRVNVTDFFQENTPKVFGIAFDEIAMAMLVQNQAVRDRLLKAEQLNNTGDLKTAIKEISITFLDLLNHFEWSAREQNNGQFRGVSRRLFSRIEREAPKELSRFAKEIEKEIDTLHEQVKLLSLGIDYRRYIRFQSLTPYAVLYASGDYDAIGEGRAQSHQDFLFCYSFVIECALRLQEIWFV